MSGAIGSSLANPTDVLKVTILNTVALLVFEKGKFHN